MSGSDSTRCPAEIDAPITGHDALNLRALPAAPNVAALSCAEHGVLWSYPRDVVADVLNAWPPGRS